MAVTSDGTSVILNPCLAYIKHLMGSQTKLSIQNIVCAKFDLETLKSARETLYKTLNPDNQYRYNGPQKAKTEPEKSVHCLEGILSKLHEIDQNASSLVFACPSYELDRILTSSTSSAGDDINLFRLNKMEKEISELKDVKTQVSDLQKTVLALMTAPRQPVNPPVIPRSNSNRQDFPSLPQRDRSSSIASIKRSRESESDDDPSTDNNTFRLSRRESKKLQQAEKRTKPNVPTPTFSNALQNGTPKPSNLKKQFTWGKASEESSTKFKGVIPEIFITRCSIDTETDDVISALRDKGINVKKVELKSRPESSFKSFKVAVNTSKDYDCIISGEPLPPRVKVRPWIYYKSNNAENSLGKFGSSVDQSKYNMHVMELEKLEKTLSRPQASNDGINMQNVSDSTDWSDSVSTANIEMNETTNSS